ncbi:MAG TPA: prepilin-type N-terminal cleavage/methylation domain-containing protein [Steroidobacteraceae bacterium]|jgi:general secretion pathway protein G|nr:prepilin-type N-terminal cleavage/methylation domain-containing protein [Steroidobacteraceae bacterium]
MGSLSVTGERRGAGFTLIELLVVMSIIGVLLTIAVPRYFRTVQRSKETVLRHDLSVVRESIDKFYGDLGQYPEELAALVDKHYIRSVPVDPFTKSAQSWLMVASEDPDHPGVRDIHSGSPDIAADGSPFVSW